MLRLIDALLILGVLINVVKGADLLLRPHQQKWLQAKCDTLALWLDYTRPIQWYMRPDVGRAVFWLSASALIIFATLIMLFTWKLPDWAKPILIVLGSSSSLRAFRQIYRPDNREGEKNPWRARRYEIERRLRQWSWSGSTVTIRLFRQLSLTVASLIGYLILFSILLMFLILVPKQGPRLEWRLIAFPIFVITLVRYWREIWLALFAIGNVGSIAMFNFVFSLGLIIGELALKLLRAFMWRVVEYNKGAFAALTLLVTVDTGSDRFLSKVW